MKTLVILAHPNINASVINKRLKEELSGDKDVTVHELYASYPDGKIDIRAEQRLVDAHDNLVFQFPVYWYNCPPLMKQWMDEVLTPDWAYMGKYALQGKTFSLAVSTGGDRRAYSHDVPGRATIEELMLPFSMSSSFLRMKYHPLFVCHNAFGITQEELEKSAQDYLEFIKGL